MHLIHHIILPEAMSMKRGPTVRLVSCRHRPRALHCRHFDTGRLPTAFGVVSSPDLNVVLIWSVKNLAACESLSWVIGTGYGPNTNGTELDGSENWKPSGQFVR